MRRVKLLATTPALLCALGMLAGAATRTAYAAEVMKVQASRDGNHFEIGMRLLLNAPAPAIYRALHDYAAMQRYNPELRAVRMERTSDPNRMRLWMSIHTCVLFFCKTIHQEELMTSQPAPGGGTLQADFLPAAGAFAGHGKWTVTPCHAEQTPSCMDLKLELAPQFWVPPMIGPWLIRRKMTEEASSMSAGLEQMARGYCRPTARGSSPRRPPSYSATLSFR